MGFSSSRQLQRGEAGMIRQMVKIGMALLVGAGAVEAAPSAEKILQQVGAAFVGLNDCTALLVAKVEAPDVVLPDTKLRFYYKRPNRTKLDVLENQLFLMPKGEALQVLLGFGDPTSQIRKNSRAEWIKTVPLNGRVNHVIKLVPQAANSPVRCYYVWIDAQRYTVSQLRLYPRAGGEWRIQVTHARVANRFWLPIQAVLVVTSAGTPPATLTFTFRDYQINTGLSEAIFRGQS